MLVVSQPPPLAFLVFHLSATKSLRSGCLQKYNLIDLYNIGVNIDNIYSILPPVTYCFAIIAIPLSPDIT